MEALQQAMCQLSTTFKERMDIFEGELQKSSSSSTTISSLSSDFTAFKEFTLNTLKMLQRQIELLQQSTDHIEMHSRRKILLLHGVAEGRKENVLNVVANLLVTKLKIADFQPEDIRRCHRLGKAPPSTERPRPILFKLCDASLRSKIWSSKSMLKATGITLSEFLTQNRHNIFMQARQRCGISKCWTHYGTIIVLDANNKRHNINHISDLDKISNLTQPNLTKDVPQLPKESITGPKHKRTATTSRK